MTGLDFLRDVCRDGRILDVGPDAGPDAWAAALGADHLEDVRRGRMRRDHGLVELSFAEEGHGRWRCLAASVQVHRLAHAAEGATGPLVPAPLARAYGRFAPRTPLAELTGALAAEGVRIVPLDDPSAAPFTRWRVPATGALVTALGADAHEGDGVGPGDVWSVSLVRRPTGEGARG
ncbi:hypothetical protein [Streptomyces sp. NPDC093225]|uniref:hypothetical protein n=1 Tax=Streptomyces sp. NPDC093225 TaxID=3366034 RepID=UPI0038205422